ncbi:redoxin family protein [Glaciecola petra]|uniref:Redoxin family protein n=1 Tax=Glaciecola petra TaxID=3075602 RepID=A0ABU2ZMK8_9ALTE|nr:redoxin family protein [Aestuariibacter sp. P117]MDT0593646.1 redoxin family protein [Aestuariibacter sp. P117]
MKKLSTRLLPLVVFLGLCFFLYKGLYSDPTVRESEVLSKTFPTFSLPDLDDENVIYTNEIFEGKVTLINVWGVWCVTCAIELPYLTTLSEQGLPVVGLYYDQDIDPDFGSKTLRRVRQEVAQTTAKFGDPFAFNIFDVYRNTALDLGVTGAPETFLVDQDGIIRVHHLGDINPRVWRNKFSPILKDIAPNIENKIELLNQSISPKNAKRFDDAERTTGVGGN